MKMKKQFVASLANGIGGKILGKNVFRTMLCIMVVGLSMSLYSCDDDEPGTDPGDDDNPTEQPQPQPVDDVVSVSYNGKVAILQPNSDGVISYLTKRLVSTTTELTEDVDVVVMDDAKAGELINNESEYSSLKKIWDQNKAVVFVSPQRNALSLLNKLKQLDLTAALQAPSDGEVAQLDGIHVFATRADGSAMYHDKIDTTTETVKSVIVKETESGVEEVYNGEVTLTHNPTEYAKGRIAENTATWLNEYAPTGQQRNVAFVSSESQHSVAPVSIISYRTIPVTHDWFVPYSDEDAKVPASSTVDAKFKIDVCGVYSPTADCDIYDVNMYEEFDAAKTFVPNTIVYEHLAYNYKYTGGCYYGPQIDIYLNNVDESSIEVEEIAPLPLTGGQYNNTHYPMTLNIGASVQGNISSEPGLSAGFSMGCTLPYTTTSFNHSEMPIAFSNDNKHAKWVYEADIMFKLYNAPWGFNPKPQDIPDVVKSFCHTDQAVSFVVSNAKSLGERPIALRCDLIWRVYHEYADPWVHWSFTPEYIHFVTISLPKVNRYFEKYTPYPLSGGTADGSEWGNLEDRLMSNVNYRALCDETLKVGAQMESGLDVTAENIWRDTIKSLVTQYNGTTTSNEYVIALAKSDGTHIPLGLHIKNGVWKLVENVDDIK